MSSTATEILEAERSVIGAILLDPQQAPEVENLARPQDFQDKRLAYVAKTIYALSARPEPLDLVALHAHIKAQGKADWIGGELGLIDLAAAVTSGAHLVHHAKLVRRASTLREVVEVCSETIDHAKGTTVIGDEATDELLADLEAKVFAVGHQALGGALGGSVDDVLMGVMADLDKPTESRNQGWKTGYYDLDNLVLSLRPTEFTVLAARPSVGKTALALNIMANFAEAGARCLFVSMEMSNSQMAQRMLAREAKVEGYRLRTGCLTGEDREALELAGDRMASWKMQLFEDYGTSVGRLASMARRASLGMGGLDAIFVDYLQLMTDPATAKNGRTEEVSNISRQLKALARELQVNVVAVSQLSRAGAGGRPGLHHLRESGSIEQDADQVIMLWSENEETAQPILEASVAKNRHGATGDFKLGFRREFFDLHNLLLAEEETIPFEPEDFSTPGRSR